MAELSTTTDNHGKFRFSDLSKGKHSVSLDMNGIPDDKKSQDVEIDENSTVDFKLEREIGKLPRTVVTDEVPQIWIEALSGGKKVESGGKAFTNENLQITIRYLNCRINQISFDQHYGGNIIPADVGFVLPDNEEVWGEVNSKEVPHGTIPNGVYIVRVLSSSANEKSIAEDTRFTFTLENGTRTGGPSYTISDEPIIPGPRREIEYITEGKRSPGNFFDKGRDVNTVRLFYTYIQNGQLPSHSPDIKISTGLSKEEFYQVKYIIDNHLSTINPSYRPLLILLPFLSADEGEFMILKIPADVMGILVAFLKRASEVNNDIASSYLSFALIIVYLARHGNESQKEGLYGKLSDQAATFFNDPKKGLLTIGNVALLENKASPVDFSVFRRFTERTEDEKQRIQRLLLLDKEENDETVTLQQIEGTYMVPIEQRLIEGKKEDRKFTFNSDFNEIEKTINLMKGELKKTSKQKILDMTSQLKFFKDYNIKEPQAILDELDSWRHSPGTEEILKAFDKEFRPISGNGFRDFIREKTEENINAIGPLQMRFTSANALLKKINEEINNLEAVHPQNKEEAKKETDILLEKLAHIESEIKNHASEFETHRPKIQAFCQYIMKNDSDIQGAIHSFISYLSQTGLISEKEKLSLGTSNKKITPVTGMLASIKKAISKTP